MPQTELKVVRCPGCNTAYNAASLPPGKAFRCKKCSSVVGASAPAPSPSPEPAQTKRSSSSRIERKASGGTSRRLKPGGSGERSERPSSSRLRASGGKQQKSPVLYIVGGVVVVAIIGLAAASMGKDDKPAPKKAEEPAPVEEKGVERARQPDQLDNDTTAHETDFAKQRIEGAKGQDKGKIDPLGDPGTTEEPPKPPEEQPPAKDPLEEENPQPEPK